MRSYMRARGLLWGSLAVAALAALQTPTARAQGFASGQGSGVSVGYIDGAIPTNQIRFRFDAAFDDNTPDRGEFFYSQYREQQLNVAGTTPAIAPAIAPAASGGNSGPGGGGNSGPGGGGGGGGNGRGRGPGGPTFVNGGGNATVTRRGDQLFIYSPQANGLGAVETRIDYQDLGVYVEGVVVDGLSGFVELPVRFLNPEVNPDTTGLADMNVGFKWAFWDTGDQVGTFQLRTYIPTGAASRGLGTNHVSVEPAFLFHDQLTDLLAFDAELRDWIPIGGTDFEGNVIRYGVGVSYTAWQRGDMHLTPVAELVGWTLLNGKVTEQVAPNVFDVRNAAGDTIVNLKMGARFWFDPNDDLYVGYGRALTGAVWYKDILRVEYRMAF